MRSINFLLTYFYMPDSVKAKFHYASWFEAGPDQLRTS